MRTAQFFKSAISMLTIALMVFACATPPRIQDPQLRAQLQRAAEYYAAGAWQQAAELYEQAAAGQQQPGFSESLLRAADARILADDWVQARLDTSRISEASLDREDFAWLQLLRAELALRRGDLEVAETQLMQLEGLPQALFARLESLSTRLQQQKLAPDSQAFARFRQIIATLALNDPQTVSDTLHLLDRVSLTRLRQLAGSASDADQLAGWLKLAIVLRETMFDRANLAAQLTSWKSDYGQHPLSEEMALRTARRYLGGFHMPQHVAVFLPTSGRFAPAASAIRDGIMKAWLEQSPGSESSLRFYSVNGPGDVSRAYIDAREDGVDWIIGPLDREAVQQLLELPGFNVPVLLLNQADDLSMVELAQIDSVFSFALLPEDEAWQMAELAVAQGLERAAVLAPDNSWGGRLADEFSARFSAAGGTVLQDSRYAAEQTDHSPVLRYLLKVDESEARHRALENLLRQPLGFEAQRRDDLDVIFLAARPNQGRSIRPQLRFFDAGDIPVYATSQIYSGTPDERGDRDLNGVRLPLSPIQLQRSNQPVGEIEAASRRLGRLDGFYALGIDSLGMLPYLELMASNPELGYPGASGKLNILDQGRVRRTQALVQFDDGVIRAWQPVAVAE